MIKHYTILLLLIVLPCVLNAQVTKAEITNVDFQVNNNKIYVTYDIENYSPIEKFIVNLTFINDIGEEFIPISTTGTSNVEITGGKQRKIVWDVLKDSVDVYGSLKARVYIEKVKQKPGNMSMALYSLVVPGLGDKYVVNAKLLTIKPIYKTISAYGLVVYGLIQKSKANTYYSDYNDAIVQSDINSYYDKANSARHQFIIATGIGAAIWLTDVGWVLYKGSKNKKNTRYIKVTPGISGLNNYDGIYLGLNLRF